MLLIEEKRATLDDLHREPGKAELVGGRIVTFMSTGRLMSDFVERLGHGETYGDNVGYAVPELPSGRESFSPDVSYFDGSEQDDEMDFIQGAPTFAVEVRSKDGYGPTAESALADNRADYFAAGTKTVWDVDSKKECIHAYSVANPGVRRTFRRDDIADAEPALPGWRVPINSIFKR